MRIPIETFTLDNGLFVTLSEDHTTPIVAVNLWYHVGSANEKPGRTGFAHLFEHMLFQGSAHVGSNEHFELIQRAGGTLNGSTWLERTNYFETVPSNELALALWLEADRMGELLPAMTQEKLDTQRDVVKNERRWAVDNQPYGTMLEKMQELVFPSSHPFQHSLIGSMEDLSAASLDDITQFFATYYTPDNAVLSVAGDFDSAETRELVAEYFGPIPKGKAKPALPSMNLPPVFGSPLREVVYDNVSLPRLFMAFRSPVFGSEKYYAASVASAVMGMRKGSRLHRSLVRERQIAADAGAFTFDLAKGTDLLVVDVTARPETDIVRLEEEVEREIDMVHREGVTESEVKRAVALIETDLLASLQSSGERADRLSMFATYFKQPELINEQADRYRSVTAQRVNDLVSERFGKDNRASLIYLPKEGVESEQALAVAAERRLMVTSIRPKPGPTRSYHFPDFHDELLPSGIRLVTAPVTKLPVTTILVLIDAGSTNDPAGKEGVAALTAGTLLEGSEQFSGAELAEKFEQLGTSVESGADWDSAFVKLTVLSEQLEEATRLLGDVISSPMFPEREVERAKAERLAEILQLEMEPRGLADEKFSEFLYATESRYSVPDEGSTKSVSALSRQDVRDFYGSRYRTGATTVIIVGDITTDKARSLIMSAFRRWPSGLVANRPLIATPRTTRKSFHVVDKPEAPQSELRVGHVGLPRKHPDFFPTLVMNAVLGGLFGSRINLNLREAHGYTYGASSFYDWRRGPGPFVISTAVQSEVTAPALREILLEIDRIRDERIAEDELLLARSYLEGVFPIRYETTAAIASALATLVIYDLPADYFDRYRNNIHAVSVDAVLQAARSHLHPDELQTIVVGDARLIRGAVSDLSVGDLHVHSP